MTTESSTTGDRPYEAASLLQKIGSALPIGLAMLATTFAGMSTGELQEAMFWRSFAAQDQSKAASQWAFAGFKRDRALVCETTAATLRAAAAYKTFTPTEGDPKAIDWLKGNGPPKVDPPQVEDEHLQKVLAAVRERKPEKEILQLATKVKQKSINEFIDKTELASMAIEQEWDPTLKAAGKLAEDVQKKASGVDPWQASAAQAAKYELEQRRYRGESALNQYLGFLYEARVKVSTAESDKHRNKSENFFYAMLAAQIGTVIASLAMSRKNWTLVILATFAGLMSGGVGAVVFLM